MHCTADFNRCRQSSVERSDDRTDREGGLRARKVRLQLRAVGAVAHKGEVRRGPQRLQHRPQRLEVLLC